MCLHYLTNFQEKIRSEAIFDKRTYLKISQHFKTKPNFKIFVNDYQVPYKTKQKSTSELVVIFHTIVVKDIYIYLNFQVRKTKYPAREQGTELEPSAKPTSILKL